jgi:hypothetical protein
VGDLPVLLGRWVPLPGSAWQPWLRHHGTVSNSAELAAVLRRISDLLSRPDVDTAWSGYEPDELRSEIYSFLERAGTGLPLDEAGGPLAAALRAHRSTARNFLSSGWGQGVR